MITFCFTQYLYPQTANREALKHGTIPSCETPQSVPSWLDFPLPLKLLKLKKNKNNASHCFACITSAVLYIHLSLLYTLNTGLSSAFSQANWRWNAWVYSNNGYAVDEVRSASFRQTERLVLHPSTPPLPVLSQSYPPPLSSHELNHINSLV